MNAEENNMLLNRYYDGAEIHREDKIIYARFLCPHRVISTCPVAGGIRDDLEYLYNHQSCEPTKHQDRADRIMRVEGSVYLAETAERYGLPPNRCATLGTAANMHCAAIVSTSFRELEVIAVCTGGVETNGGRAGDPATVYEYNGRYGRLTGDPPTPGTVNTMLFINRELTLSAMVRSIVTATEAKTAALQELSIPSRYSSGLATGTGTDQIGIASRIGDPHPLKSAGKHSKLGELIGRSVHDAVKETLTRQNGMTPESRCAVSIHLERFGASLPQLIDDIGTLLSSKDATLLKNNSLCFNHDPLIVAATASFVHVRDQLEWGVLPKACIVDMFASHAAQLAASVSGRYDRFDQYRTLLSQKRAVLENSAFLDLICRSAALGFADKWQFESQREDEQCQKKDC